MIIECHCKRFVFNYSPKQVYKSIPRCERSIIPSKFRVESNRDLRHLECAFEELGGFGIDQEEK